MRGRTAKRLRRLAHDAAVGKKWRYYQLLRRTKDERPLRIELHPECGRRVYKTLKRAHKLTHPT